MNHLKSFERLVDSLSKMNSIGRKSAERIAYGMLDWKPSDLDEFCESIQNIQRKIKKCPICGNFTEDEICSICSNENRDKEILMVVSYSKDILSIEKSEGYHGLYHVLGGAISIKKGKGVEDLNIESLLKRIDENDFKEIILATNPDIDGETTALYIAKRLSNKNIAITRLAYGLQMGGALDYVDSTTLLRSLEGRRKI